MPERPTYYWDAAVARFRSGSGRFVSAATVRARSRASTEASFAMVDSLATRVHGGSISVAAWEAEMQEQIKREYIRQGLLGYGGRENMTPARWGSLGGQIGRQRRPYLSRFASDIVSKDLTEAQIRARSRMYIESAKQAYERAQWDVKRGAGYEWVRWNLTDAEHCPDCIDFASLGWQRASEDPFNSCYPASGCSQCLSLCKCFLSWATGDEPPPG